VAITWPIFIEVLLHMLMGNADTLMLSQYNDDAVAAVGVANQLLFFLIVLFGFISSGTTIVMSQYLGANQLQKAKEVAFVSLFANFIFSLVISLFIYFFSRPILQGMNLEGYLLEEAHVYLALIGGLSFIQALIMTESAILKSYGMTKETMVVTIGMNVLNVIGNYLFIFGPFGVPVLGVEGVAISTVVSRFIGLICLGYFMVMRTSQPIFLKLPFITIKQQLNKLLSIGIPTAGEQISYSASQLVITYFITLLGTEMMTTRIYTQNMMMFIVLFGVAIGQGTQILIGHYIGANMIDDAYKRCLKSTKWAIALAVVFGLIIATFSKPLLSIFTTNHDIIAMGSILLWLTVILEPGRSFNLVIINALRATGDAKFPVVIGVLSMWGVSVTLAYLLGIVLDFGLIGIWIGFIVDEWLRGLLVLARWKNKKWIRMSFVPKQVATSS